MDIAGWDQRYRSGDRAEDQAVEPVPLVARIAQTLKPGRALDLACGAGRNAIWLAAQGWDVTAADGSPAAIELLKQKAPAVHAIAADLERGEFAIELAAWDLILMSYYLQRDLFEPAKAGLGPGGVLIAIVHVTEPGEDPNEHRAARGELTEYFRGWEILHSYEGPPNDRCHRRSVAEIVVRRSC
jgi:SAM-dependent methyltransferase